MNVSLLAGLALASLTAFAVGCADVPLEEEEQGSSASEIVSEDRFADAAAVVKNVNYLSYGYKRDGCYARALYMSAELAAKGFESNSLFAFATDEAHMLKVPGAPGKTWGYHVAPMLKVRVGTRIEARVIDPSIASEPLQAASWVAKMGYTIPSKFFPHLSSVAGSEYATHGLDDISEEDIDNDVANFRAMPKFAIEDIQHACGTMFGYLSVDPRFKASQVPGLQTKLIQRTKKIISDLSARSKLASTGGARRFDEAQCRSCRAVQDAKDTNYYSIVCN